MQHVMEIVAKTSLAIVCLLGLFLHESGGLLQEHINSLGKTKPGTKPTEDPWIDTKPDPWIDPIDMLVAKALGSDPTPDPWVNPTPDPWVGPIDTLVAKDLVTDPTPDPWVDPTADPWVGPIDTLVAKDLVTDPTADPWVGPIDTLAGKDLVTDPTADPWVGPIDTLAGKDLVTDSTPDPWINPNANPSESASSRRSFPPTTDPWVQAPPISERNANNINYNLGASGSTARCQDAIRQCSLFDVDTAAMDNVYQEAFATMLKKQRLVYQANLIKVRDYFINQFNQFILNLDVAPDSVACPGADEPVVLKNDPTDVIPRAGSVQDVIVPPLTECVVSEWSSWSVPLAFGVVERKRTILKEGQCCPDELVEQVNITKYLDKNHYAFENPNNVAENFNNDFLNNEPRDILIVVDTSSSIYVDDFEVMKDGIKTMIDIICGSFGYEDSNNHLAIMQFSNVPVVMHYFSDPQTPEALKAKVDQMEDFGGKTCTGDALLQAHDEIFRSDKGARGHMPNDTLVVTDGHANCGADLLISARYLQARSQSIYALGIGISDDPAARGQVTSLVTNEDPHHIFSLARYMDFKRMIEYIKYLQHGQTCVPILAHTPEDTKKPYPEDRK